MTETTRDTAIPWHTFVARPAPPPVPELHRLDVSHLAGDAYAVHVRGHWLLVDQPPVPTDGGDAGPTATELFAASLASCVAFYAGRYLARHHIDRTGLRVHAEFTLAADRPARVADVRVVVSPPAGLPEQRRTAMLAVASHCTVHNSLQQPPGVEIELA
jgi:uncharacterized OsmC-like protein